MKSCKDLALGWSECMVGASPTKLIIVQRSLYSLYNIIIAPCTVSSSGMCMSLCSIIDLFLFFGEGPEV